MNKSERLKPRIKIKFKYFILAHILALFFALAPNVFATNNIFDFNQESAYSEPFSKLIEFLDKKKNELAEKQGDFLKKEDLFEISDESKTKSVDVNKKYLERSAPKFSLNFSVGGTSSSLLSAVFESVKSFVVDKPKIYLGTIFDSAKSFVFPGDSQNDFEYNSPTSLSAKEAGESAAREMENLKQQYAEAIEEAKSASQKFNLLQTEMEKIKNSGVVVREPVIEQRVVERTIEKIISGLSQADLDSGLSSLKTELNNLNANLTNQLNNLSAQTSRQNSATYQAVSLTNKIDSLTNTTITTPTISNPTITGTLTNQTLSNSGNATISGALNVSGLATFANSTTTNATIADNFWSNGSTYIGDADADILTIRAGVWSLISAATSTVAMTNGLNFDSNTLVIDPNSNRVGLGTSSPYAKLSVVGPVVAEYFHATSTTATSTFSGQTVAGFAPTLAHSFGSWSVGAAGANPLGASFIINPSSAASDSNLLSLSVNGSAKFLVDAEGDVFANAVTVVGGTTLSTTTASTFTVENNTYLGDATTTDITYFNSRIADSLIPTADNLLDLGDSTNWLRWRTGYFGTSVGIGGTATSTGTQLTTSGAYLIDSGGALSINTTNNKAVSFGTGNVVLPYASTTALTVSNGAWFTGGNVGVGTTSPYAKLSVVGETVASYFTATTTSTSTLPQLDVTGLQVASFSELGTVSSGAWQGSAVGSTYGGTGINSSALTGLAQIVSGTWSASSTLSTAYGGTGWQNLQANTVLLGNGAGRISTTTAGTDGYVLALSNGVPTWLATSTLSTITGTLAVGKGGTGQTSFGQGWLNSNGTDLSASTSPTVNYITATSTTATSTFPYLSVTTNSNLGTVVGGTWQGTAVGSIYGGTGIDSSALTGIAQIVSGTWSASSTLSTAFGGTGWNSIQSNSILLGNGAGRFATTSAGTDGYVLALSNGVPTWLATSTLSTITGTLAVAKGGTGQTSFGQGWLNSNGTDLSASTSPTVNYITATSTTATSTFPYLSVTTNSNLGTVVGGTWQGTTIGDAYLTKSGDWTGTLDTYNGSDLLARANHTGTQNISTLSNYDWTFSTNYGTNNLTGSSTKSIWAQGGINASSTSNFVYASTTALTVSGSAYLGSLNGPLQANNGLVSATTSIGSIYGGTGLDSSALTGIAQIVSGTWSASSTLSTAFGGTGWNSIQSNSILLGNGAGRFATTSAGTDGYVLGLSAGVPTWLATSTLSTITGTLAVSKGGTGAATLTGLLQGNGTSAITGIAGTAGQFPYYNGTDTLLATSSLFLATSGNVGIGTTSPYAKLSVVGETVAEKFTATSTTATSTFAGGMNVAGTAGLTVLQNGNVGIGTAAPESKLHLQGSAPGILIKGSEQGLLYLFDNQGTQDVSRMYTIRSNDGKMIFGRCTDAGSCGYDIMTMTDSNNVGIGTTTPGSKLSVTSGLSVGANYGVAAPSNGAIIEGNVGIGTTSPYAKLSVVGETVSTYFTATSTTATSTFPYLSVTTNSNLGTVIGGTWNGAAIGDSYLTKSGDWTGTLDTYNGSDLLARANHTGTQNISTLSNYDWTFSNNYGVANLTGTSTKPIWAQGGINASSTSNFVYASTTALTVSGTASTTDLVVSNILTGTTINLPYDNFSNKTLLNIGKLGEWGGYPFVIGINGDLSIPFESSGASSQGTGISFIRSRGNNMSARTASQADDELGYIDTQGFTDGRKVAAKISMQADTGWGATGNDSPGRIVFSTTPDGSATLQERMRIDSAGNVGIGTTSPYAKLSVVGETVAEKFTATSTTATSTFPYLSVSTNSNLGTVVGGTWQGTTIGDTYLTKSGDWTGTLDTYEASSLLARANHTGTQGVSTLSNYDWTFSNNYGVANLTGTSTKPIWAQGGINASSTSNFVYASTTALTVSGTASTTDLTVSNILTGFKINLPYQKTNDRTLLSIGSQGEWGGYPFVIGINGDLTIPIESSGVSSGGGGINFVRSRGNDISARTASQAGDELSFINSQGFTDGRKNAAKISIQADTGWGATGDDSPGRITFWTTPDGSATLQERMRIDSAGNVGIGTTSPQALLTVGSSTPAYLAAGEKYNSAYVSGLLEVGGTGTSTIKNNLYVVGTLRATVSYVGDLIFGNNFRFTEADPALTGSNALYLQNQFGSTTLAIDENGNIGIGTTSPAYKLHVLGDIAATSFVNTSTKEAKKDITYLASSQETDFLDKIKNTSIARYHYNLENQANPLRLGLIAEEAPSEILSADGKGVDVYKMATFTLGGVKALQKEIEKMKIDIAVLSAASSSSSGTGTDGLFAWITDKFRSALGIGFGKGELCLEDVCVNKAQLKELLEKNSIAQTSSSSSSFAVASSSSLSSAASSESSSSSSLSSSSSSEASSLSSAESSSASSTSDVLPSQSSSSTSDVISASSSSESSSSSSEAISSSSSSEAVSSSSSESSSSVAAESSSSSAESSSLPAGEASSSSVAI